MVLGAGEVAANEPRVRKQFDFLLSSMIITGNTGVSAGVGTGQQTINLEEPAMRSRKIGLGLGVVVVLGFLATARGEVRYTITDLGDFAPSGLNNHGQVAGVSGGRPSIWKNGVVTDLGKLGDWTHWVWQINDHGRAVGWMEPSTYPHSGLLYSALLYDDGQITELGTLGGDWSGAMDINDAGQIVGWSGTVQEKEHAFLWENGVMTDLGTLPGGTFSNARAINNLGQIVGIGASGDGSNQVFMWEAGQIQELIALGDRNADPYAINDSGQVVGRWTVDEPYPGDHAFVWQDGLAADLGTLGGFSSLAWDINNSGQVVGYAYTSTGVYHASLWEQGIAIDLNDLVSAAPAWELESARGINDSGQIVGAAILNGEEHGFLLTPIPEPATFLLMVFGVAITIRGRVTQPSSCTARTDY